MNEMFNQFEAKNLKLEFIQWNVQIATFCLNQIRFHSHIIHQLHSQFETHFLPHVCGPSDRVQLLVRRGIPDREERYGHVIHRLAQCAVQVPHHEPRELEVIPSGRVGDPDWLNRNFRLKGTSLELDQLPSVGTTGRWEH